MGTALPEVYFPLDASPYHGVFTPLLADLRCCQRASQADVARHFCVLFTIIIIILSRDYIPRL